MKTILRWSVKRPALPGVARCMARATPFALPVACLLTLLFMSAGAQEHRGSIPQTAPQSLDLTVGKSLLLDSILPMERVSVGLGGFAEVTAELIFLHAVQTFHFLFFTKLKTVF